MAADSSRVQLVNNTNYFNPRFSRIVNTFLNPSTFKFKEQKQEGIETRLYYEFRDCQRQGGQTFFYTLTYTDSKLPHFEGVPCFDYKDLMSFLNGGFKKKLLRDYGTNFRYFVGAEFGEGAGSRGLHQNPHYHVLLFLRPDSCVSGYKPIPVSEMRHLVKMYWQGFDEEKDGYHDYRDCKFGIAKPSDRGDLVEDFKACSYCAKYVTKDVHFYKSESIIRKRLYIRYFPILYNSQVIQNNFFVDYIIPRFAISPEDLPSHCDWYWSCSDLLGYIAPKLSYLVGSDVMSYGYLELFQYILKESNLVPVYTKYVQDICKVKIKEQINLWRNRFSNKYRISNGLGAYALSFIDESTMRVPMPNSSGGLKNRPIPLYYFRKICCTVTKDYFGNNKYMLNNKGVNYVVKNLHQQLERIAANASFNINQLNKSVYEEFLQLYPSALSLEDLMQQISLFDLCSKYAEYKFIYEYRFYPISSNDCDIVPDLDYENFIQSSLNDADFCPHGAIDFIKDDCQGYIPYSQHSYFAPYIYFFHLLDFLSDYYFLINDRKREADAIERKRLKKFHQELQLKSYFKQFNV